MYDLLQYELIKDRQDELLRQSSQRHLARHATRHTRRRPQGFNSHLNRESVTPA